ncbi:hypothetical protein [Mesorhizobium comanense]|uniref:hypothetical protein n=1 Tax=Mesorhizobium comanense TaxID=2502215 RepID=UPI0010F833FD|nr:hypothetical protein [Mesorhizobium comanense]
MAPLPQHIRYAVNLAILDMHLTEIDHAYSAAVSSLKDTRRKTEDAFRRALGIGPNDPLPEPETDEEGGYLDDMYDQGAEKIQVAENSIPLVRKAFVIALFHLWERHCNDGMKVKKYVHEDAMRWVEGNGGKPNRDGLRQLELACHCAKHGPGLSSQKLWRLRANLFPGVTAEDQASERRLVITDQTFDEFLNAVSSR